MSELSTATQADQLRESLEALVAEIARLEGDRDQLKADQKALSDAYLRLRAIIPGAFDTPLAPSAETVWKTTEQAAQRLAALTQSPAPHQGEGMREALEAAATVAENWQHTLIESCPNHMPVYPSIFFRDKAVADAIRALANTPKFMSATPIPSDRTGREEEIARECAQSLRDQLVFSPIDFGKVQNAIAAALRQSASVGIERAAEAETEAKNSATRWKIGLERGDWKPTRAHIESARNSFNKIAELLRSLSPSAKRERQERGLQDCRFCKTVPGNGDVACPNRDAALRCAWLRGPERVAQIEKQLRYLDSCNPQLRQKEIGDLSAERDRLLQSSGGECAHSTDDGRCLFATRDWSEGCKPQRCPDCPGDPESPTTGEACLKPGWLRRDGERASARLDEWSGSTPAEPNPPGSGEPVAWQWREKNSDGNWSEWQIGSANTDIWYRRAKGNYELRNLYAATLPSPSEGAMREAANAAVDCSDTIVRELREFGVNVAEFRLAIQSEIKKAILRTCATATGGGDNG